MSDSTTINSNNFKLENLHAVRYEGVIVDAICSQAFLFGESGMSKRFIRKDSIVPLCACGCGARVTKSWQYKKKWNKFINGHNRRNKYFFKKPENPPLCACGCGKKVKWNEWGKGWNKFLFGHQNRDKNYLKRFEQPPLCACGCKNLVEYHAWKNEWNEYILGHNPNKTGMSEKFLTASLKNRFKKGYKHTKKWKDDNSKRMMGKQYSKGYKHTEDWKKATSKRMLNGGAAYMNSFIKNPSKPQVELFELIKQIYPNVILNYPSLNRSIDIAIPEKMIAIEYDGSYWHQDKEKDKIRQKELEAIGWNFLRYVDYVPSINELKKDLRNIV